MFLGGFFYCNLLFVPHEYPGDPGSMHLPGARGAALLTAEATEAGLTVNDRLSVLHGDGLDGNVLGGLPSVGMLRRDQIHRFRAQTFLVGDPITPGPSFS